MRLGRACFHFLIEMFFLLKMFVIEMSSDLCSCNVINQRDLHEHIFVCHIASNFEMSHLTANCFKLKH